MSAPFPLRVDLPSTQKRPSCWSTDDNREDGRRGARLRPEAADSDAPNNSNWSMTVGRGSCGGAMVSLSVGISTSATDSAKLDPACPMDSFCSWSDRHISSAFPPIPLSVTSSRAIAMSRSSSSPTACKPSVENLPSMASKTRSFLPINRRQVSCCRIRIGKVLDCDLFPLADAPGPPARLAQRIE